MTTSSKKETGSKQTPFGKYDLRKNKEQEPREYENWLDETCQLEGRKNIYNLKKRNKDGSPLKRVVPKRAYVHETGDLIDLNCCLTPWCENFGKPCLTNDKGDGSPDSAIKLSPNYSLDLSKKKGVNVPSLKCDLCGDWTHFYSNRSASEIINRYIRKYAPALFCDQCSCKNANGILEKEPYIWNYDNPEPGSLFKRHGVHKTTGAIRLKCKECGGTKSPFWNPFPKDFSDILKNPENHVRTMHDVANLSLNDYRRSHVYMDRLIPKEEPSNPKLGENYYRVLDRYQFLAAEWIGHYNNQIRYGKADIKPITKRKNRDKKKLIEDVSEELSAMKEYEEELAEEVSSSLPSDIDKKHIPSFCMPQIQTDAFDLSVHTPGSSDKRHQLHLMVSVLVPSGYILLATLSYSDQYNHSSLEEHDTYSNRAANLKIHELDREISIHAHNEKLRDSYLSPDKGIRGRLHTIDFEGRGVRIRQPYHSYSHNYVLEKIVSKIPNILVVQDMDKVSLRSCVWAFRRRIAEKTCHVITTQVDDEKAIAASILRQGARKSNKYLTEKLEKEVVKAQKEIPYQNIRTRHDGFRSALFLRGGVSTLPKKKVWITQNTLMGMDSMDATMMLRTASLFMVDSVCNQLRKRVRGLHRGEQTSKNSERSYVSHWKNPLIVQQLVDVFVFSRNCLAWHSVKEQYFPPVVQLGLSKPNKHLIHYIHSDCITSSKFIENKYCLPKPQNRKGSK